MEKKPIFDLFEDIEKVATLPGAEQAINMLKEQFEKGHGKSGFQLACIYDPGNTILSEDVKRHLKSSEEKSAEYFERAFEVLSKEAESGNAESMYLVSQYYQSGIPPVAVNREKSEYWINKAIQSGFKHVGQI